MVEKSISYRGEAWGKYPETWRCVVCSGSREDPLEEACKWMFIFPTASLFNVYRGALGTVVSWIFLQPGLPTINYSNWVWPAQTRPFNQQLQTLKFLIWVSIHFSLVTQSCLTLCDPTDCSMQGFHVLDQLPELAQTHVHQVGDVIQPSHPPLSPSSPAFNHSQHQGLF